MVFKEGNNITQGSARHYVRVQKENINLSLKKDIKVYQYREYLKCSICIVRTCFIMYLLAHYNMYIIYT